MYHIKMRLGEEDTFNIYSNYSSKGFSTCKYYFVSQIRMLLIH